MSTAKGVICLPDATGLPKEAILQAALYFQNVYLEAYTPEISGLSLEGRNLRFACQSWFPPDEDLTVLKDAEVLLSVPKGPITLIHSFSSRKLPSSLRHAVADSLADSTALLAACMAILPVPIHKRHKTFQLPFSYSVGDPDDLSNPQLEMMICLHLASIFRLLGVCALGQATPLVGSQAQSRLLFSLASEFPEVAKALGLSDRSLLPKQHAIATEVMRTTLPNVRVRHPEQILSLRQELKDELERLRAELGRLSAMVSSCPWEPEFQREVERLIAKEVVPAVAELNSRLSHPSKRIIKHLVSDWKTIVAGTAVPLSAFIVTGANLPWAILGAVSAGLGLAALKAKVEEWAIETESAVTYLFEARKKFRKAEE